MGVHKGFFALFLLLFIWLAGKVVLPFLFPFLLGAGLALASEPLVHLGADRLRLPRGAAAGLGVTVTLLLILGFVVFLGALIVKELSTFLQRFPEMIRQSADLLADALTGVSSRVPEPAGSMLTASIHRFFQDSTVLSDQAVQKVPGLLTDFLGKVPGSAVWLATGILSAYFISARLPRLKTHLRENLPAVWREKLLPTLRHLKGSLGNWLLAQGKLMLITYGIVALGLLLLRIPYAFAWAILIAAVDAIPLLGTGTVLLPWALLLLLQQEPLSAAGMLGIYLVAVVTRTVLEPRFYGRHLGLDPLIMLLFLYFGYRLWGFLGVILAPLLAATTKVLTERWDTG